MEGEVSRLTKAALYAFDMLSTKESDTPRDKVRKWLKTTNNEVAPTQVFRIRSPNNGPIYLARRVIVQLASTD